MGTLYIDRKGYHLKLDREAIAFYLKGRREGIVPINPLRRVVIVGNNTVDTSVLNRLLSRGIPVMFLSGRHLKFSGILAPRMNYNGLLRMKQYQRSLDREFVREFSARLILKKLSKQMALLQNLLNRRPTLGLYLREAMDTLRRVSDRIETAIPELDSLRGYEGGASSAYFGAISRVLPESLNFNGRNRRPPRDPVNAMLSLCYTFLYYETVREILIRGLDPTVGFYHQFDYGRDSLACDVQEVFRPDVDEFVIGLFEDRHFRRTDFVEDSGGVYLKKNARARLYPLYETWAVSIRKGLEEFLAYLCRRLTDEEDPLPG